MRAPRERCPGGTDVGGLSIFYINRGEILVGAELAERVLTIAEANRDDLLEVLGTVQLSLARSHQGRATESLGLATRALATYHPERHQMLGHRFGAEQGVAAHVFAGWSHLTLGHLDRGIAQLIAAVDLAEALGRPFNRVFALAFLATGHWERGKTAETLHFAQRARNLAEEQGFPFWAGISGVWEAAERVITLGDHAALGTVIEAGLVAGETGNRGGNTAVLGRMAEATLPPATRRPARRSSTWRSRFPSRQDNRGGTRPSSVNGLSSSLTRRRREPWTTCRTQCILGPAPLRRGARLLISPTGSVFP